MWRFKTLKGKLNCIYVGLVLIIVVVGAIAVFNVYRLGRSIDGLITDNYKSIDAVNNMENCIETQERAVLEYVNNNQEEPLLTFYNSNDEFYKWLYVEKNNITEKGEGESVAKLNNSYTEFVILFGKLQQVNNENGREAMYSFYEENLVEKINEIKSELKNVSKINEVAMFNKKDVTRQDAERTTYMILVASVVAALVGLILSIIYANKYLEPIHLLTQTIKSVKEGAINKEAPIVYDDEIGLLALEFNHMTARLYEFEQSTKGTLLAEKNRSTTIVKSISDPLIVLDADYRIKFINNSCERFFHLKEEAVLNKHFLLVINNAEIYDYVFKSIKENNLDSGKIVKINNDNKTYFFNITVTHITGKDEMFDGVIVLFKNVTELKELERIKTDFIGTISHELKTPLTSVMMGVGLIGDEKVGTLNQFQQDILETIEEDAVKLNDLVSNLLKISEIESNKEVLKISDCNIQEIIQESVERYMALAIEKSIALNYEAMEGLPLVKCDKDKILWVLNNLVSNAIRYTANGGEVFVTTYLEEKIIKVCVRDTGRGIPEEYLEKIFDKFVRVEEYEVLPESTGLGLAIAKEIVNKHGGEIWCESKLRKGSLFTFTLEII